MKKQPNSILEIGRRLLEIREQLNLTQHEIAESLGVTPQWYGKVERGHSRPSIEMLIKLHSKYNIDLTFLLTGSDFSKDNKFIFSELVSDCPPDKLFHLETILRSAKALYLNT